MSKTKPFGHIYQVTNTKNGRFYIGQTTISLEDRLAQHLANGNAGIREDVAKYGRSVFTIESLRECFSHEDLSAWEMFYYHNKKAEDPKLIYNRLPSVATKGQKFSRTVNGKSRQRGIRLPHHIDSWISNKASANGTSYAYELKKIVLDFYEKSTGLDSHTGKSRE